jgi:hypothetical protein
MLLYSHYDKVDAALLTGTFLVKEYSAIYETSNEKYFCTRMCVDVSVTVRCALRFG